MSTHAKQCNTYKIWSLCKMLGRLLGQYAKFWTLCRNRPSSGIQRKRTVPQRFATPPAQFRDVSSVWVHSCKANEFGQVRQKLAK